MGVSFKRVSASFFLMLLSVVVLVNWAYPTSALADQEHGLVAGSALLETQADDISAVAVFDPSDGSLTFYNRTLISVPVPEGTTVYDVPLDGSSAPWLEVADQVLSVSFTDEIAPISMQSWFAEMLSCTSMDLAGLDTSNVTDMSYMFYNCKALTSLDLSSFDTLNVTDMSKMFNGCWKLNSLDLSSFDTSNVTDMRDMFNYCSSLKSLDLSSFDTSHVKDMSWMFNYCDSFMSLNLSSFDTSCVTDMTGMFQNCSNIRSLDLTGFDTPSVTNMGGMFAGCVSLKSLDLSSFDTSNVTIISGMFSGCQSLASLNLSSFDTSNVTDMRNMFNRCFSLESLDLSSFDISDLTDVRDMFSYCSSLSALALGEGFAFGEDCGLDRVQEGWSWAKGSPSSAERYTSEELVLRYDGATMAGTYYWSEDPRPFAVFNSRRGSLTFYDRLQADVPAPAGATVYDVPLDGSDVPWSNVAGEVLSVYFADRLVAPPSMSEWFSGMARCTSMNLMKLDTSNVEFMSFLFDDCSSLTYLDLSRLDTSKVKNMSGMFQGCSSLASLDLSPLDTSSATDVSGMFGGCSSLTALDLSGLDTSKVKNMSGMFQGCSSLASLDLSPLDTSSATDVSGMFGGCSSLTALDLSGLDTSKVKNMSGMFQGCSSLASLDLSPLDTSSATDVSGMFGGCSSLTALDLSGLDTSKVKNMSGMFQGCSSLASLDLSPLDTSSATDVSGMFGGCSSLTALDLSPLDTSSATDVSGMFGGCSSLTALDLSPLDTSSATDVSGMFGGCSSLESLDLSSFDASSTTSMQFMFYDCVSLSALALGEDFAFGEGCGLDRAQEGWSWAKGSPSSAERYTSEELVSRYDGATMAGTYYWSEDAGSEIAVVAVFDPSAGSLAFYNRARSDVPTPDGATVYNVPMDGSGVPWSEAADRVLSVSFADMLAPTSTAGWFSGMSSCTSMDLAGLDTSGVADMSDMFQGCSSLTSLDLSGWDTSGATNMSGMFQGCSSLASLDVSDFDTSSVEYMFEMFEDCSSLASLDLSGWDTSSVVLMSGMFDTCSSLTSLDISDFNTSSVLDMSRMFRSCSALVSLDLSSFDTSSVEYYMSFMFYDCSALVSLELPSFDTSKVTSMSNMFHGCSSLTSLDLSGWDNSSVIDMSYMFQGCSSLTSLDLSDFGTSNVKGMQSMFSGCSSLTSLDLSDFDTSNVEGMQSMFSGCVSLESLDLSAFDTSKVVYLSWMLLGCESLTALDLSGWDTSSVADMGEMFKNCSTLSMITFGEEFMFNENSGFDRAEEGWSWAKGSPTSRERYTSEDLVSHNYGLGIAGTYYWSEDPKSYAVFDPTEGSLTFYDRARSDMPVPAGATVFDVLLDGSYASWSEVADRVLKVSFADELAPTSTQFWFSGMTSCTSMDLTKLDTSNVTDMSWMFEGCTRLTSLDLSSFNTACTENMSGMFDGCSSLASLDLAPFKTSNVKNMTGMFLDCSSLTALDLSGFDTLSVTAMDGMFYGCSSLESLDLSSFDTSSTASMQFMFYDCASLSALALGVDFAFGESCGLDRAQEGWSWAKGSPDSRERYTSEQLVSRYDGAKMAGTYYFAGDISRVEVSGVVDKVYTGKALYQSNLRVFLGGQELAKDVGYSVAYSDNVNAGTATVTITGKGDYAGTKRITFEVLPAALGTMTFGQSSYVYDGKQKNPAVTVKAEDGTVLKAGADYDLAVPAGRTDAGSYTYTATGKGNYAGTKEIAFTISPAKLASMTLSPSSYTYDGSPKNPVVTVRGENGATLKYEKDYDLTIPSGRVAVGSYTFIAKGKGNYTGSAIAVLKVTAVPAPPGKGVARPHRLYGDTALDTMSAIVDAGAFPKGGTVVLATSDGYWDALTAAGIAGLANAPVLMTDGKSLSSQTRAQIAKLKPKTIVICGGPAAVSRAVESQAKSAAGGATAIRCQGDTATGTACKIFENGSKFGSWSGTAFVCTNAGYWDALAAAPISYAKHMPIFLTEGSSSISGETLGAMRAGGVKRVYIVGGRAAITSAVESQLRVAGIAVSGRLWGNTAIETSEAVAYFGIDSMGMSANNLGVATSSGYWDALAGAALCGRKGSVLVLADGPQAHSVTSFARSEADSIADFYIFGGTAAVSKATENAAVAAAK